MALKYEVTIPEDKIFDSGYKTAILSYKDDRAIAIFDTLRTRTKSATTYYILPMATTKDDWDHPKRVLSERILNESKVLVVDWPDDAVPGAAGIAQHMLSVMMDASEHGCVIRISDLTVMEECIDRC